MFSSMTDQASLFENQIIITLAGKHSKSKVRLIKANEWLKEYFFSTYKAGWLKQLIQQTI